MLDRQRPTPCGCMTHCLSGVTSLGRTLRGLTRDVRWMTKSKLRMFSLLPGQGLGPAATWAKHPMVLPYCSEVSLVGLSTTRSPHEGIHCPPHCCSTSQRTRRRARGTASATHVQLNCTPRSRSRLQLRVRSSAQSSTLQRLPSSLVVATAPLQSALSLLHSFFSTRPLARHG